MTTASRWRWQEDLVPGTPEGNMAADALLLHEVGEGKPPAVRVYAWDRPSVSCGRLQDEAAVRAAFPGLPLVRRPTGGRAVRHGDDLCVTVAARLSDLPPLDGSGVLASYRLLAGALIDAFRALDIPAVFGDARPASAGSSSVDCFAAVARCDIIDGRTGRKLAGCAQRREGAALLQQMSIPPTFGWIGLPQGGAEEASPRNGSKMQRDVAGFVTCVRQAFTTRLCVVEWVQGDVARKAAEEEGLPPRSVRSSLRWGPPSRED